MRGLLIEYRELVEAEADDPIAFNTALSKLLKKLKRDVGATRVWQGYKGTGRQKHRRQIWVDIPWYDRGIDLWLDTTAVRLGGVISPFPRPTPSVTYADRSPKQVYAEVLKLFKAWKWKMQCLRSFVLKSPATALVE